jgi:pimeloyl-ACP methyl ester carboxylesterase
METLQTRRIEPIRFDIAAPATVTGGSTNAVPDGIDPNQRRVNFNIISSGDLPESALRTGWGKRTTWVVIHGWDNPLVDAYNNVLPVAQTLKEARPNDIVLTLDWMQASSTNADPKGNWHAATWIGPVADWAAQKLKDWGLTDSSFVNFVGHSFGSFMSSEIAARFGKARSITALDPADDTNLYIELPGSPAILGGYDLDLRNSAENKPRRFDSVADFSRAFVGGKNASENPAGDRTLASTAHESFILDYDPGPISTAPFKTHGWVVDTFRQLIDPRANQASLANGLFALNDNYRSKRTEFRENSIGTDSRHEGVLRVNEPDQPVFFVAKNARSSGERDGIIYGTNRDDKITALEPERNFYNMEPPIRGNNTYYAGDGDDEISGGNGKDRLFGGNGNDALTGQGGNDTFVGGEGGDVLTGGDGSDSFVFDNPNEGPDTIMDFASGDEIVISASGFGAGLASGGFVPSDQFLYQAGSSDPTSSNQRFIYNVVEGNLYFDADGSGSQSPTTLIANLLTKPILTSNDIVVTA